VYYPTNNNGWCVSRCGYFGSNYEWCFTNSKLTRWDYCSSTNNNVLNRNNFIKIERNLKLECSTQNTTLRKIRGVDLLNYGVNDLTNVILRNEQTYQNRIINNQDTSITGYSTINAPLGSGNIELTVRIRALIRFRHLQPRTSMPNSLNTLIENLDARNGDERGHLIAATLGGNNEPYNIVPQYRGTNRRYGSTSHWYTVENEIRNFINRDNNNYVSIQIVVLYGNIITSRRPTGFYLQAIFYNGDGTINRDTGNCYFTNNPEGPSDHEPDLGFFHDELRQKKSAEPKKNFKGCSEQLKLEKKIKSFERQRTRNKKKFVEQNTLILKLKAENEKMIKHNLKNISLKSKVKSLIKNLNISKKNKNTLKNKIKNLMIQKTNNMAEINMLKKAKITCEESLRNLKESDSEEDFGDDVQPSEEDFGDVQSEEDFGDVQPSEEDFGDVQPLEEDFGDVQPLEEDFGDVQPLEEDFGDVQPLEEDFGDVQPSEEEDFDDDVQPSEEDFDDDIQPSEEDFDDDASSEEDW